MLFKILEFTVLLCIGHLAYAQGENHYNNYNYQNHNYNPHPREDSYRSETSDFIFPDQELPVRESNTNKESTGSNSSPRISEQKCKEYNKGVVGEVQVLPLVANPQPISIKINKCDHNSVPLIVGGKPASSGKFPYMAALGFNTEEKWLCGGTLISKRFILTAAHCTISRSGSPEVVRLGALYLSQDGGTSQDYRVSDIIVHPNYHYPDKYNDIALVKVDRDINFTTYIRPACLYTKEHINHKSAIATGWGRLDYAGESSDRLMEVNLNIYDNSLCQNAYRNNFNGLGNGITATMICAGELKGGKDTCQGDSGGPLVVADKENQCKFYIIGVTSFGKSCAQINTPAVYTKVSKFVPWIEKIVWK